MSFLPPCGNLRKPAIRHALFSSWKALAFNPVCAAEFILRGQAVNADELRRLKAHTSAFFSLRGSLSMPTVCRLAVSGAPESRLERTLSVYRSLKSRAFFVSARLAPAAVTIAKPVPEGREEKEALTGVPEAALCAVLAANRSA